MSFTNYFKNCDKTTAGNFNKLFITKISDISGITITTDQVSAIVMETGKEFGQLNADLNTVQITHTLQGKTRQFISNELTARFTKKTVKLQNTIKELSNGVVCGLVAIRVNNDKQVFISGISVDKNFSSPWDEIEAVYDSGLSKEDIEEGNSYNVILRRNSIDEEIELDSTLSASVLDGTANFIDWTNV